MWQDKLVIHKLLPPLVGLVLVLLGCSPAQERSGRKVEEKKPAAASAEQQTPAPDCVRGEPEALLSSQSEFNKSSPGEALEMVRTGSPVQLTIRHFGCTHYALDFEFTWPGPRMPELQVSLKEAAGVLEKLPLKEAYRPMMEHLVAALRKMAQEPGKQPLTMSDTETLAVTTPSLNVLHVRYDVAL